jgi:hypothetical protein
MHYVYVNIDHILRGVSVLFTIRALRTGHEGIVVRIPVGARDFYLLQKIRNVSVDHPWNTRIKRP